MSSSAPILPDPQGAEDPRSPRLLSLAAWTAVFNLLLLAVPVLLPLASKRVSHLTEAGGTLAVAAMATAAWLLMAYPLWPGELLGEKDPRGRFWQWLALRACEVLLVLLIALPFMLTAGIFSGDSFARVGVVLVGLCGTAVAAIAYRYVHIVMSERLRAWALIELMFLLFAPLVAGYLSLEIYRRSIGWCWLISPLALARDVALSGLPLRGEAVLVGLVGYSAVSALSILVFHLWALQHVPPPPTAK